MPQITKDGKYIFGWAKIKEDGKLSFPTMAIKEYKLEKEKYVYIISERKNVWLAIFEWYKCKSSSVLNGFFGC